MAAAFTGFLLQEIRVVPQRSTVLDGAISLVVVWLLTLSGQHSGLPWRQSTVTL